MYYLLVGFSYICSKTPIRLISFFSWCLAILAYDILRIRRSVILSNLDIAFKDRYSKAEKVSIGRASYHHLMLTSFECARSYFLPFSEITEIHGQELMDQVYKSEQPAFLVIAHIGNWEVMAPKLASFYPNVFAIVKKVGSDGVNRFVASTRARNDWVAIEKGKAYGQVSRKIIKALKQNSFIGFPMDQRRNSDPLVSFFGQPSHTNHTLANLWLKYKTPVLGAYAWRDENYKHHVQFLPPLDLSKYEDSKDAGEITLAFNGLVEQMILKNPKQYLWQHERWKVISKK